MRAFVLGRAYRDRVLALRGWAAGPGLAD